MKVSELTGAALDWAVAKCEGADFYTSAGILYVLWSGKFDVRLTDYSPSADWAQGGPIIERESIDIARFNVYPDWEATMNETDNNPFVTVVGPTPLIAAMRCLVSSRLGDTVEVPDEL